MQKQKVENDLADKPERRYCQGCGAYYPVIARHRHGNRVCQLDVEGMCCHASRVKVEKQ
jgi:hypothetical protein